MTKTMEVTNLLDIHTREELYSWYFENHDKVSDFWLRVNRAREPYPDVVATFTKDYQDTKIFSDVKETKYC